MFGELKFFDIVLGLGGKVELDMAYRTLGHGSSATRVGVVTCLWLFQCMTAAYLSFLVDSYILRMGDRWRVRLAF